ncbi:hypothetical protein H2201_004634 [Coniosporium apollinis]|uniref:Altered inheritance of mitochondria protein 9, mitochondrial n=1 Tax=Coniosporium apollinis TaxID=61459 RepID=A0ABQ9NSG5_9PEZI|nr:hypothetical protein H2201_004634 [Coniosporium apollinis]
MARRHTKFNMNALADIAVDEVGALHCVNIEKCSDGLYNKSSILTMDCGRQVVAKVRDPNAGLPYYTTASEVATMHFVRDVFGTPAPQVYASNANVEGNLVGAEYIIMEKVRGIQLRFVWARLHALDKAKIVYAIARHQRQWSLVSFRQFGSLYYAKDVEDEGLGDCFYTDSEGHLTQDPRFAVSPATGRDWVDAGRAAVEWDSVLDYRMAVGHREIAAIKSSPHLPKQMAMLSGSGIYEPSAAEKLSALQSYLNIIKYLLPTDSAISASHLWHNDLHDENIFVGPSNPTKITGIIDWQGIQLAPLFDHTLQPAFLNYDGPEVEGLEQPALPDNLDALPATERRAAIKLYHDSSLVGASRILTHKKSEPLYRALEFQNSHSAYLLLIFRNLFEIGEAQFRWNILTLEDRWADLPGVRALENPAFPLSFSAAECEEIETDVNGADVGIQVMETVREALGEFWPDKGCLGHE